MLRFLLPLILFLVIPDVYIGWLLRHFKKRKWYTFLLVLPTVVTLLCMICMMSSKSWGVLMQVAFVLLVCIAFPKLIFFLFALVNQGIRLVYRPIGNILTKTGFVVALLIAFVQIYGTIFGWKKLETKQTQIETNIPLSFDNYRVVHISDLHLGTYLGDEKFIHRVVDSVNAQQPDLIVFTGDIVNNQSDELLPYTDILSQLKAKDGVYSVLGNHDYCYYNPELSTQERQKHLANIVKMERQMGWHILLNENCSIVRGNDTIYIAGEENTGKPPFPSLGNLQKTLQGVPSNAFTLLLSHDPWHWHNGIVKETAIPLTLSGHTHALQLKIGEFSPAQWLMPEWEGLYEDGNRKLYVSTGIGGSVPYRLGVWPMIDVLILKSTYTNQKNNN